MKRKSTAVAKKAATAVAADTREEQLVTMRIDGQLLGIPIRDVREIMFEQKITPIPLVSEEIVGALNLRGRIVTAIDIRRKLQLPTRAAGASCMFVVVEFKDELYSLVVDSVGDVLIVPGAEIQDNPPNLETTWRNVSAGVYRLEQELLIILAPQHLFTITQ